MAAATAALHLRDPHQTGSWGLCPLYVATGLYCPGCGGLRAVNDLTHGEVASAASSNLLLVAAIPVVVVLWALWTRSRWRGDPKPVDVVNPYVVSAAVLLLVTAFSVVRNLPFGSWLAP